MDGDDHDKSKVPENAPRKVNFLRNAKGWRKKTHFTDCIRKPKSTSAVI